MPERVGVDEISRLLWRGEGAQSVVRADQQLVCNRVGLCVCGSVCWGSVVCIEKRSSEQNTLSGEEQTGFLLPRKLQSLNENLGGLKKGLF